MRASELRAAATCYPTLNCDPQRFGTTPPLKLKITTMIMTIDASQNADTDTDLMARPRILKRAWKRKQLPSSTSLPLLSLIPANRPLFTCLQCGFANTYIAMCLWCTWSDPAAARAFEADAARPGRVRRLSAPAAASRAGSGAGPDIPASALACASATAATTTTTTTTTATTTAPLPVSASASASVAVFHPHAPRMSAGRRSESASDSPPIAHAGSHGSASSSARSGGHAAGYYNIKTSHRRARVRQGLPAAFLAAAPASASSPAPAPANDHDLYDNTDMDTMPSLPTATPARAHAQSTLARAHTLSSPNPDRRRAHTHTHTHTRARTHTTTTPTPPPPTPHPASLPPLLNSPLPSPPRTLRRKQQRLPLTKRSSCSLRSRASEPASLALSAPPSLALSAPPSPVSVSVPDVRLGHPSRPYYTAIRKNMASARASLPPPPRAQPFPSTPVDSRPASPASHVSAQSQGQAHTQTQAQGQMQTQAVVLDGLSAAVRPQRMSVPLPHAYGRGCSLSGEIELRMALATRRSADAPDARQEFRFRDMGPPEGQPVPHGGVKGRVKRFGKGLRNLVLGRS